VAKDSPPGEATGAASTDEYSKSTSADTGSDCANPPDSAQFGGSTATDRHARAAAGQWSAVVEASWDQKRAVGRAPTNSVTDCLVQSRQPVIMGSGAVSAAHLVARPRLWLLPDVGPTD
jgi:hypothetical protein